MANLILPSRRIVQPQGLATLDTSNPLSRGLLAAFCGDPNEVVARKSYGQNYSRVVTRSGVAHRVQGSGSVMQFFGVDSPATSSVTIAARITHEVLPTGGYQGMVGKWDGLNDRRFAMGRDGYGRLILSAFNAGGDLNLGDVSGVSGENTYSVSAGPGVGGMGFLNGQLIGTSPGSAPAYDQNSDSIWVGTFRSGDMAENFVGAYTFWAIWTRALSPQEHRQIALNPWQLFRPVQRRILVAVPSGGTSHTLDAAAQASAAASAALSVQANVQLAGSGQAQASAAGTLSVTANGVSVSLDSAGAAQAAASAALAKAVMMSAQGSGQASGSPLLWHGVSLAAAGLAVSSAAGSISHAVPLTATAAAVAQSGANLALAVTLSASALAQAGVAAGLSTTKSLGAAGTAQAIATANLYTSGSNSLGAAGSARASGDAVLSLVVGLSAVGAAKAVGGGSLWLDVPLGAAAFAQAQADGGLTLWVPLAADALSTAQGSAVLAGDIHLSADGHSLAVGRAELQIGTPGLAVTSGYSAISCGRSWAAKRRPRRYLARNGGSL